MKQVIEVSHLKKQYASFVAVKDISFSVNEGEIFGILGPNGAGKTTTVETIIGLREPSSGSIRVLGLDPHKQGDQLKQRIGVQLQEAALPERVRVWEALDMFSSFYKRVVPWEILIKQWGLEEKRNTAFGDLSGGQKQRLFIALALVNDPEVVFLDELTTGLDPQARRHTWDMVRAVRDQGKTVVLVTHFMDEAENLCDRLAIVDQGMIVGLDTPRELIKAIQPENRVSFTADATFETDWLTKLQGVSRVERDGRKVVVYGNGALLATVAAGLADKNVNMNDLGSEQATLEDVFIALTGHKMRS